MSFILSDDELVGVTEDRLLSQISELEQLLDSSCRLLTRSGVIAPKELRLWIERRRSLKAKKAAALKQKREQALKAKVAAWDKAYTRP